LSLRVGRNEPVRDEPDGDEAFVLSDNRIEGESQQDWRDQIEEAGEDACGNPNDDRAPVVGSVDEKEPFHRVLDVFPLLLERVVVFPVYTTHSC